MSATTQLTVVVGVVLAYVMKDRIKNITNEYLNRRLRKFDHKSWLYGPSMAVLGLGMVHLRTREAMRFLRTGETPEQVLSLRMAQRTLRPAEVYGEEVIHYRKLITMTVENARERPPGYLLHDILRLHVRHFLARLDEPLDSQPYFDAVHRAFAEAALPKVYHLDVILVVRRISRTLPASDQIEHLKVVLEKQRIVRVERLGAHGAEVVARG